jgi:hypothetical protein
MSGHALQVRRLRFRDRVENAPFTRARIERALDESANASRLDEETILCLRRLRTSMSRLDRLPAALEMEIGAAARPAFGPVPASANAILFADRAELLACMARDWCAGGAAIHWWWSVLFSRSDIAEIVRRAWLEEARSVPAAFDRLAAVNLAETFACKLAADTVSALWRNLVGTFQLGVLEETWSSDASLSARARKVVTAPPWTPWLRLDPALSPDIARVVVTAVLLERAPVVVRSASFARDVRQWIQGTEPVSTKHFIANLAAKDATVSSAGNASQQIGEAASSSQKEPSQSPAGPSTLVSDRNRFRQTTLQEMARKPTGHGVSEEDPLDRTEPPEVPGKPSMVDRGNSASGEAGHSRRHAPIIAQPQPQPIERGNRNVPSASDERSGSGDRSAPEYDAIALPTPNVERIATEWGGVLYLINVAIGQGLYGDFTVPLQTGLALPVWDFLALVGEAFAGETFRADPLPRLFARLSGRGQDEPPGAEFEPPSGEPLRKWLDGICRSIDELLRRTLHLGDGDDLVSLVLNRSAKIVASSSRMDAYFSLAEHPVELRIAGLDRDPGWIPAAGRAVHFHYE